MTADTRQHDTDQVRPLDGVTVVAVEHAVAAPFATRQLADLGARVIKVERPGAGDFARRYDESVLGQSSHFVWLNRGKESISLDLKSSSGREVLDKLIAEADVFVQNLAPGAAERLGLGGAELTAKYERLVHCSISGYGSTGPMRLAKAYDLLMQAEVGLISITGSAHEGAKAGIPVADIGAGMYALSGIMAALLRRAQTGRGTVFEVSLFDALAEWMSFPLYFTRYGETAPPRSGASHATIAPYGPFETMDGAAVVLAVQNDREWLSFCKLVILEPALASDERFETNSARVANRDDLHDLINNVFARVPRADLVERLRAAAIGFANVNEIEDLISHPQLVERNRWRSIHTPGGEVEAILPPLWVGPEPLMGAVPSVGEHTDEILTSLGYTAADISQLKTAGAV